MTKRRNVPARRSIDVDAIDLNVILEYLRRRVTPPTVTETSDFTFLTETRILNLSHADDRIAVKRKGATCRLHLKDKRR